MAPLDSSRKPSTAASGEHWARGAVEKPWNDLVGRNGQGRSTRLVWRHAGCLLFTTRSLETRSSPMSRTISPVSLIRAGLGIVCLLSFCLISLMDADCLSASEMSSTRGTSIMVCTYTQSCDAYNQFSGQCAGQVKGTACSTCSNGATQITYLDMITNNCQAPQAPGLKYGNGPPANVNCGNQSANAMCDGNAKCVAKLFGSACSQPDDVVSQ